MKKRVVNLSDHLQKWGCCDFKTQLAVVDLLKLLGYDVKDMKIVIDEKK